ncbi:hypothetical protein GGTG_14341, partial [Gaeumannomyces tritici R3-111a-1]
MSIEAASLGTPISARAGAGEPQAPTWAQREPVQWYPYPSLAQTRARSGRRQRIRPATPGGKLKNEKKKGARAKARAPGETIHLGRVPRTSQMVPEASGFDASFPYQHSKHPRRPETNDRCVSRVPNQTTRPQHDPELKEKAADWARLVRLIDHLSRPPKARHTVLAAKNQTLLAPAVPQHPDSPSRFISSFIFNLFPSGLSAPAAVESPHHTRTIAERRRLALMEARALSQHSHSQQFSSYPHHLERERTSHSESAASFHTASSGGHNGLAPRGEGAGTSSDLSHDAASTAHHTTRTYNSSGSSLQA